jgi:hypothetical protein
MNVLNADPLITMASTKAMAFSLIRMVLFPFFVVVRVARPLGGGERRMPGLGSI